MLILRDACFLPAPWLDAEVLAVNDAKRHCLVGMYCRVKGRVYAWSNDAQIRKALIRYKSYSGVTVGCQQAHLRHFGQHAVNTASCLVGLDVARTLDLIRILPRDQDFEGSAKPIVAESSANKHLYPPQYHMRPLVACPTASLRCREADFQIAAGCT